MDIDGFLDASERVLGLRLVFKDLEALNDPGRHGWHEDRACAAVKADPQRRAHCHDFCTRVCSHAMAQQPAGRIHTCPFSHTEIAVPVEQDGLLRGWLAAGPVWRGRGAPPRDGLVIARSRRWLADRHAVLRAIADQLAALLARSHHRHEHDRRQQILTWVQRHLHDDIGLADLADHLELSASRAGHVVREHLHTTFPALVREQRCRHAARLLISSDDTVAAIGRAVGIPDTSRFIASFRAVFGTTPARWRAQSGEA